MAKVELLKYLMQWQRNRCFWCRGLIARPGPPGDRLIVSQSKTGVTWLRAGLFYEAGWASLDHVYPQWHWPGIHVDGIDNLTNLVAACVVCNTDRGRLHGPNSLNDPTGLDQWRHRLYGRGVDLLQPLPHPKRR